MSPLAVRKVNGVQDLNTRQVQIVAVTSMLIFVSTASVILRLVSRQISVRKLFPDDHVIIVALVGNHAPGILQYEAYMYDQVLCWGCCICQYIGKTSLLSDRATLKLTCAGVHYGLGQHSNEVSPEDKMNYFIVGSLLGDSLMSPRDE